MDEKTETGLFVQALITRSRYHEPYHPGFGTS